MGDESLMTQAGSAVARLMDFFGSEGVKWTADHKNLVAATTIPGERLPRYTTISEGERRAAADPERDEPWGYLLTGSELREIRRQFPWLLKGLRVAQPGGDNGVWFMPLGPRGESGVKWAREMTDAVNKIRADGMGPLKRETWKPHEPAPKRHKAKDKHGYVPIIVHATAPPQPMAPDADLGGQERQDAESALTAIQSYLDGMEGALT